jgi:hypothetical protein
MASVMLRDGVLVRASRPSVLRVLRHPDGCCADARLGADAEVAVATGHPSSGRSASRRSPIERRWRPRRSQRSSGRARRSRGARHAVAPWPRGSVRRGSPAASAARLTRCMTSSTDPMDTVIARPSGSGTPRARRRRERTGAHQAPRLCYLSYRFDPDAREEQPPEEEEPDAANLAYVERFGDDLPRYCGTCLFRKPEDVEACMVPTPNACGRISSARTAQPFGGRQKLEPVAMTRT